MSWHLLRNTLDFRSNCLMHGFGWKPVSIDLPRRKMLKDFVVFTTGVPIVCIDASVLQRDVLLLVLAVDSEIVIHSDRQF